MSADHRQLEYLICGAPKKGQGDDDQLQSDAEREAEANGIGAAHEAGPAA